MSPEVQNRGISGPTKRTYVLQKFLKQNIKNYANYEIVFIWPWLWSNDLGTQTWPRYWKDVRVYRKWSSQLQWLTSCSLKRQTHRQTDSTGIITYPHMQMVKCIFCNYCWKCICSQIGNTPRNNTFLDFVILHWTRWIQQKLIEGKL